jgi:phage shock protein PspC (stress-responsive transcriptional regulator)
MTSVSAPAETSVSAPADQAIGIQPPVQPVAGPPRLCRHRCDRVIAGVSSGIAEHLDVPVLWVRVSFVALAGLGGAGLIGYALLWAFLPATEAGTRRPGTARDRQQGVGLVVLGTGLALAGAALGTAWGGWVTGPLGVALVGAVVVWREADASQRTRWRSGAGVVSGMFFGGGRMALLRVLAGIALVTGGIAVFLVNQGNLGQWRFALLAAAATLVGVAVLTVPWWLRLMRALSEERRARIRTEERAEIAAHLHDSVLQTLALIQQQSDSAREVRRLARGQERELRSWLYGPQVYGRTTQAGAAAPTFAATLHAAAGEVEDTYAVSMQVVVVGDCALEEPLPALVQASREAMVNAAKHAGIAEVSVYAEVEAGQVHVFVRDRGSGFDPACVAADRHGLADSIRGRMERNGGTVALRTAPGEGTEVQLAVARRKGGEDA